MRIVTTNVWTRWSHLRLSVGSFNDCKDHYMYSHNQQKNRKGEDFFFFFFLHFVQKSPLRGKCCFQILWYNFHKVCSLVIRNNREEVYLILKMHIRKKIPCPPFVVKMPKLVISLKDNEEKQNCSKQQCCNKEKLLQRPSVCNQHLKHSEKEIRPWKRSALLRNRVNERRPARCRGFTHTPFTRVWAGRATFTMSWDRCIHRIEFRLNGLLPEVKDFLCMSRITNKKTYPKWFYTQFSKDPRWYISKNASFQNPHLFKNTAEKKFKPQDLSKSQSVLTYFLLCERRQKWKRRLEHTGQVFQSHEHRRREGKKSPPKDAAVQKMYEPTCTLPICIFNANVNRDDWRAEAVRNHSTSYQQVRLRR